MNFKILQQKNRKAGLQIKLSRLLVGRDPDQGITFFIFTRKYLKRSEK